VYGDPGRDTNNSGRLFEFAAQTHERQVRAGKFPGVPSFRAQDAIKTVHVSTVQEFINVLKVGNIVYLAYFGHSYGSITIRQGSTKVVHEVGILYIGDAPTPDTNLSHFEHPNNTAPTAIPANLFRKDGQVRLFGCQGGYGKDPIAQQMTDQIRIPVYGYSNKGGSIFTDDPKLGHGLRSVTEKDRKKSSNYKKDVWLIPLDGKPTFKGFAKP
jgi:hypothetical protein